MRAAAAGASARGKGAGPSASKMKKASTILTGLNNQGEDFKLCRKLPPSEEWIFSTSELEKPMKGHADTWIPRKAVVSRDRVDFARHSSDIINETILLDQLVKIETNSGTDMKSRLASHTVKEETAMSHRASDGQGSRDQSQALQPQPSVVFGAVAQSPPSPQENKLTKALSTNGGASRLAANHSTSATSAGSNTQDSWFEANIPQDGERTMVFIMQDRTRLVVRAETVEACHTFVMEVKSAKRHLLEADPLALLGVRVRKFYDSSAYQTFMYLAIGLAYIVSIYDAQTLPAPGSRTEELLTAFELTITIIFSLDIFVVCLLPIGGGWEDFVSTRLEWMLFDFFIVVVSWIALYSPDVPGLASLRLFRVFRVVKLLKKWPSLRNLVGAISGSMKHLAHNFAVVGLVTSIFAILSTKLFRERSEVYFGTWSTSFFTMAQLATGEGWPDVTRSLWDDPNVFDPWVSWYMLLYVLSVTTILMNVAVAVLLDEFLSNVAREKEIRSREMFTDFIRQTPELVGSLDPLLAALSFFATPEDLSKSIKEIFEVFDVDNSGSISYSEMGTGLQKLRLGEAIDFSVEDWQDFTDQGHLCDLDHAIGFDSFERRIRTELREYSYRMLAQSMNECDSPMCNQILSLKLLLADVGIESGESRGTPKPQGSMVFDRQESLESIHEKPDLGSEIADLTSDVAELSSRFEEFQTTHNAQMQLLFSHLGVPQTGTAKSPDPMDLSELQLQDTSKIHTGEQWRGDDSESAASPDDTPRH